MNVKHYSVQVTRGGRMQDANAEDFAIQSERAITALGGVEVEIPGPTPAVPGEPFAVQHTLGVKPERVTMVDNGDQAGIIYANVEDKAKWTADRVIVRCSVGSEINMTIRLTKRPE